MPDCVEFGDVIIKKIVAMIVSSPPVQLLPEEISIAGEKIRPREVFKKALEEVFKKTAEKPAGKVCLTGKQIKDDCIVRDDRQRETNHPCCKFEGDPKLILKDVPEEASGSFGAPPAVTTALVKLSVRCEGPGMQRNCKPPKCDDDVASCDHPILDIYVKVTTPTTNLEVKLPLGLDTPLSLKCKAQD